VDNPQESDNPTKLSRRATRRARRAQAHAEGRCLAKTKSTGKRCKLTPVAGRPTCRKHGGNGGAPIKHGRFVDLAPGLKTAYLASLNDPTLHDLDQTLALLDGLVKQAGARAADLDTPQFRKTAVEMLATAREQIVDGRDPIDAIGPLGHLLEKGLSQVIAEDRLFRLVERFSMREETRQSLNVARKNVINAQDLTKILVQFLDVVRRLAPPDLAVALADALQKLLVADGPEGDLIGRTESLGRVDRN
jgi:hypothetical protein